MSLNGCSLSRQTPSTPTNPPPVSVQIDAAIRLTMFQTGWVSVKRPHLEYKGPAALRLPAIVASTTWTEWLPITAFVLQHPEGIVVVDTGESARMLTQPDYPACDSGSRFFYRRNLRFLLDEADELGPQMQRHGLDPASVDTVVMTHLHSDHMGGMRYFPQAKFVISDTALSGHMGALLCRIPESLNIQPTAYSDKSAGVFRQSQFVTNDGVIKIVPTSGHANGHQSVLVERHGLSVCLVGDAAFSLSQIMSGHVGGVSENVTEAQESTKKLRQQYQAYNTIMLPTHDSQNTQRLLSAFQGYKQNF